MTDRFDPLGRPDPPTRARGGRRPGNGDTALEAWTRRLAAAGQRVRRNLGARAWRIGGGGRARPSGESAQGRRGAMLRRLLPGPAAGLMGAILIGTVAILLYIEASVTSVQQDLPVDTLGRQRLVAVLLEDLVELERAIARARAGGPAEADLRDIRARVGVARQHLNEVRRVASDEPGANATAIERIVEPILVRLEAQVRTEGAVHAGNFDQAMEFAERLVTHAHQQVQASLMRSNDRALKSVRREADHVQRFGTVLTLAIALVSILGFLLTLYVLRGRRLSRATDSAQQRLRDAIDNISEGFALFDARERLIECNARYADLFPGVRDQVVPGARFEALLEAVVATGAIPAAAKDPERWLFDRLERFRNPGEPLEIAFEDGRCYRVGERRTSDGGTVVIATEITELRQREVELRRIGDELQHKNVLFDAALDNMIVGLAMFDGRHRLIICNQRYLELYDLPHELGRPGTPLRQIIEASAQIERCSQEQAKRMIEGRLAMAAERCEVQDCEFLANGRVIERVHRPMAGGASLATYEDITARHTAVREMCKAKEEAELASRAKSEFLANVSHELRTPLNAIIGFSEIIKSELFGPLGPSQYREYATDIYDSGRHLLSLINDILDLSKIEAGKFELQEEALDVAETMHTSVRLVRERAEHAGVRLRCDIADALPRLVADQRAVKQILLNLLSNAVKFTKPGDSVAVRVALDEAGGLAISVADTGIGMAPEDQHKALSPFEQADPFWNRRYEGTGLGLPLCKRLIELHGGHLRLDSALGEGTTITVHFPASRLSGADSMADQARAY